MTGVTYQANSDRPTAGVARIDCMAEILFDMTHVNLAETRMCLLDDWIAGTCRCINAIPGIHLKAAWVRVFAKQMALCFKGQTETEFTAAIADRLHDEAASWHEEKRTHYGELAK